MLAVTGELAGTLCPLRTYKNTARANTEITLLFQLVDTAFVY